VSGASRWYWFLMVYAPGVILFGPVALIVAACRKLSDHFKEDEQND